MTAPPPGPKTGILVFARHQNELAKDGLILNDARGYAAHILDLDLMLVHLLRQNSKKTSIRAGITPAFPC